MTSYINLIFRIRGVVSVLAHANPHRVTGITLPPVDASELFFFLLFHCRSWLRRGDEEEEITLLCPVLTAERQAESHNKVLSGV